ncbi:MAG: helix-turn-helix domain-containing protein [Archaeoglobus sp.]|nr:helix-turn-helix domain-containing protein [Archaeoglobus sp.]
MEVYTPAEVAKKLKVNVNTIYEYIKQGKLKAAKIGNRYRISEEQLQEFFKQMSTENEN